MFTTAQIVGLSVLTLAVIAVAFVLMRLDAAIGTPPLAEEDDAPEADSFDGEETAHLPSLPAGSKTSPRSQRRRS